MRSIFSEQHFLKTPSICSKNVVCLHCSLIGWEQGSSRWKAFLKKKKISHKQLTWVFFFISLVFLLQFHLYVKPMWAVQIAGLSQNQVLVTLGLKSKHRKWSLCLVMTCSYELTCCFCLYKAFRCLLALADCHSCHPSCLPIAHACIKIQSKSIVTSV